MGQDIDIGFGCEWLFMKSFNSAVQLSWSTLHAQNVLLLLLSSENQEDPSVIASLFRLLYSF